MLKQVTWIQPQGVQYMDNRDTKKVLGLVFDSLMENNKPENYYAVFGDSGKVYVNYCNKESGDCPDYCYEVEGLTSVKLGGFYSAGTNNWVFPKYIVKGFNDVK